MRYRKYKLSDICELQIGRTPPRIEHEWFNNNTNDYTWVSIKDMGMVNKYIGTSSESISIGGQKKFNIPVVKSGTLLLSFKLTVGKVAIATKDLLTNEAIAQLPLKDKSIVDNEFLYYYLKIYPYETLGSTSSIATAINSKILKNMDIELPDIVEQRKIVSVLKSIDDKIELNNKINKNLEEQILSYYQKLFIKPNNESSKWSVLELSKVTTNIRDKVGDNNYPVFSAINTGNLQFSEDYFNKQVFSKDISKYIVVDKNDFAYNPARINIGSIGINDLEVIGCVSPVYVVFRVEKGYHNFFNIYIKSNNFKEEVKTRASGSVRQTLNYEDLAKIQIQYPPKEVIEKFNAFCDLLLLSIKTINIETNKLIEIRNTLLPKLMSGEIDVSNIVL